MDNLTDWKILCELINPENKRRDDSLFILC